MVRMDPSGCDGVEPEPPSPATICPSPPQADMFEANSIVEDHGGRDVFDFYGYAASTKSRGTLRARMSQAAKARQVVKDFSTSTGIKDVMAALHVFSSADSGSAVPCVQPLPSMPTTTARLSSEANYDWLRPWKFREYTWMPEDACDNVSCHEVDDDPSLLCYVRSGDYVYKCSYNEFIECFDSATCETYRFSADGDMWVRSKRPPRHITTLLSGSCLGGDHLQGRITDFRKRLITKYITDCKRHAGYTEVPREQHMVSGAYNTCVPDACHTVLQAITATRLDVSETRSWFAQRTAYEPDVGDMREFFAQHRLTFKGVKGRPSPSKLLSGGVYVARLEITYEKDGKRKKDAHMVAVLNGTVVDNVRYDDGREILPVVASAQERKDNRLAMTVFRHLFHGNKVEIESAFAVTAEP